MRYIFYTEKENVKLKGSCDVRNYKKIKNKTIILTKSQAAAISLFFTGHALNSLKHFC